MSEFFVTDEYDLHIAQMVVDRLTSNSLTLYPTITPYTVPTDTITYADLVTYTDPDCKSITPLPVSGPFMVTPGGGNAYATMSVGVCRIENDTGALFSVNGYMLVDDTDGKCVVAVELSTASTIAIGGFSDVIFILNINRAT